jgi:dynein heavy chain
MEEKRTKISEMMTILSAMCLEDLNTKITRMKVETLVTIQVHQYDISQEVKSKDVNDFEWQK